MSLKPPTEGTPSTATFESRIRSVESELGPTAGPFVLASNAPAALNRFADFRCTGTNDHDTIQDAVDSAGAMPVFLSAGTFACAGGVTAAQSLVAPGGLIGTGRASTIITQSDDASYVYTYNTPIAATTNNTEAPPPVFQGLTLQAKFGLKLNQSGDYTTVFSKQAFIFHCALSDILFDGKYNTLGDANMDTANATVETDLEAFGIGLNAAKCFDLHVKTCHFKEHGVAARLDGCDISKFDQVRFHANARHVYVYGHDTFGGRPKFDHCEFLVNRRLAGVYIDTVTGWWINDSYFENTTTPALYLETTGDISGHLMRNYIANPAVASADVIKFGGRDWVAQDNFAPSTHVGKVTVASTTYNQQKPVLGRWKNNRYLPTPTVGLVNARDTVDRYLLSFDNFDPTTTLFGTGATTGYPWIASPTTGRQVLQTTTRTIAWRVPLKETAKRTFEIRYTGRFMSGTADAQTVTYTGVASGVTTTLSTGAGTIGFSATTEVETLSQFVTLPTAENGDGYFDITLENQRVEFERIELIPVDSVRKTRTVQTLATNAAFTLLPTKDPEHTIHTGTLTANRIVTLSTTNAVKGATFRITRTGGGAFTLDVGTGPLKSLATNTWCEVLYDGAAWVLAAYGAL